MFVVWTGRCVDTSSNSKFVFILSGGMVHGTYNVQQQNFFRWQKLVALEALMKNETLTFPAKLNSQQ
jgi:hypothetical protein